MDRYALDILRAGGSLQESVPRPDAAVSMPRVSFTPDESAEAVSQDETPTNLAELDAEIARTAHPTGRAVLQDERARLTAPKTPPKPPPTWDEVTKLPQIQALPFDQREAARHQYFLDVVAPQVPTEHLDAARAAFDADTKPGILNAAIARLSEVLPKQPAAPNVGELDSTPDVPVSDAEAQANREALGKPARMTMTRAGEQVLQGGRIVPPAEEGSGTPTAPLLESVKAVPKLIQLGAVQAIPQMARQYQDLDQTIQDATAARDALKKRLEAKEPYTPPDYNTRLLAHSGDTPFSPEEQLHQKRVLYTPPDALGSYESEIKGLDSVIKNATEHRDHYAKVAELVGKDIQKATPKDQGMAGKMITTAAQSAAPMILALATRRPTAGAIPGSLVQGAQAYDQAITAGEDARKRLPEYQAASDKLKYIRDIADNEDADDVTRKAAANVFIAMQENAEARKGGVLSSDAEAKANAKAIEQFGADLKHVGDLATVLTAKRSGLMQMAAEFGGEQVGLAAIMKPGSKLLPKLSESIATNFGQEFVTQGLQTLDQALEYDPTITLKDALEQMVIAGGAGAVTAAPLTVGSHVLEKGLEFASKTRQAKPAAAPAAEVPPGKPGELPTVGELLGEPTVTSKEAAKPEADRIGTINGLLGVVATSLAKAREDGNQEQIDHYEARAKELVTERAALEREQNPDIDKSDLQLQNRDRSTPASVAQMNTIANNPDYDRLATAPTPDVGAPMVAVKGDAATIPAGDKGKASVVTMGDGTKIPVTYAVVEADSVLASHDVNGKRNAEYFGNNIPAGQIVTLTNGRVAGVQGAYERGTAETYKAGMLADPAHGVSAEAINAKTQPMLVRVYDDTYNKIPRLAQLSNTGGSAQLSELERARNDAAAMDSLDGLVPTDTGDVTAAANMPFVRRFMQSIPETERPGMLTATGELSQAGAKRLRAAVFAKAYGGGDILARMVDSTDNNMRAVTAGLMKAAPAVAQLREKVAAGALHDLDITPELLRAVEDFSRLRENGISVGAWLAQADMFGVFPREIADFLGFMERNSRSGTRVADLLTRYLAAAEAIGSPAQSGMFEKSVPGKDALLRSVIRGMGDEHTSGLPEGAKPAATPSGPAAPAGEATGAAAVPGPGQPGAEAEAAAGGEGALGIPAETPDALKEEIDQALSDLGAWAEKNILPKAAMLPDGAEENLLPILARLFEAAIKMGYRDFSKASKWVMAQVRKKAAHLADLINDALLRKAFDHASSLRSDAGQVREAGTVAESGQDQGGKNLQRGAAERGGAGDQVQPGRAGGEGDQVGPGKKTGILKGDRVTVDGKKGTVESTGENTDSLDVHFDGGGVRRVKSIATLMDFSEGFPADVAKATDTSLALPYTHLIQSPERATLRKKVIQQTAKRGALMKGAIDGAAVEIRKEKQFYYVMGLPASGKSAIAGQVQSEHGARIIDADIAKELFPEFANGIGANSLHIESADVALTLLHEVMDSGENILYPGVGKGEGTVRNIIASAKKNGYTVHLYFVDLPVEKAMERVVKRFRQTGRFIPPGYLKEVAGLPRQVFERVKQESIIKSWSDYSNDVPFGSKPRLLAQGPEAARADDRQRGGPADDSAVLSGRERGVRPGPGGGPSGLQQAGTGEERVTDEPRPQPAQRPEGAETGDRQGSARPAAASPADRGQMGLGFADQGEVAGGERQAPGTGEGTSKSRGEGPGGRPDERGVLGRTGPRDTGDERGRPAPVLAVASNYVITAKDDLGGGGDKTKTKQNLAAIRLLKQLTAEKRPATPEEQAALVKYVGWGGLKSVFDERNADTAGDRTALKDLLTPSEFEAARRSVLDAHYTSETVINGIYQGLARLGFSGGRVLEPGVGIGHFFGLMPSSVAEASQLFGVELDSVTGGIARLLYPRADIKTPRGFQEVNIPAEYFDAAIGNPPFGNQPIADETGAEIPKMSIHNFFFAKALNSLRPGGVLAMVTSHYFLDANNSAARTWMAKRAELVGAIRLPNNAFLKNAGTEVTTDIVFLRKLKAGEKPAEASWVKVGSIKDEATGEPIAISPYFIEHPEMMLGKMTLAGTMYGGKLEATLEANKGEDLGKALENAVATLPQGVFQAQPKTVAELAPADVIMPDTVKVGGLFTLPDGRLAQRTPDVMDKPQQSIYEAPNERAIARIKGMIGVRDAVRKLMHAEMADEGPDRLAKLRSKLNVAYDEFKAKHGFINSLGNRRAFQVDPDLPLLESLERHYDPGVSKDVAKRTGEDARAPSSDKATIFAKRVISPAQIITKADSAGDALSASLSERGKVDLPYMAQLYGKPPEDILKELQGVVFNDPKAGYVTADEYLSGNVKKKLAEARAEAKRDPRMNTNVEALERVQPKDIQAVDISVRLGSPWVPAKDVGDFIESLLGDRPTSISYQPSVASWLIDLPDKSSSAYTTTWGAKTNKAASWSAARIITATLNSKPILVRENAGTKRAPNWIVLEAETDAARAKGEAIAAKFKEWIFQDQSRRDRLARMYNDKFNTDRTREYNGSHLTLPGANPSIVLTPNKKHSVWRMIQSKSTLLDHVVGSGKTYTIAAAMMEKRRLGISRKPMVVVPNHIVRQWRDSWYALYPNANILAATEEDFERGNRQRLFARIATGDWDGVIVAHSAFSKISMPKAERDAVFHAQINDITAAIEELKKGKGERYTVRQLERAKLAVEDKLKAAEAKTSGKDQFIDFSELGVDDLAVDESQEFKNLFYTSQMRNVTGMGNPEGSGKAFDLFVKTRYLRKRNGKITFATGTPMSNSLVEMFSIQRYLDYDTMRENGLAHLDAWAGTYADIQNVWEVHPSGNGYRLATRFAQFVNLPELVTQYKKFSDIITQQDMIDQAKAQGNRYPIPKVKGGKPIMHIAKRSPQQAAFMGVPEFLRDEDGKIQFKRAMNDGQVMSRKDWVNVFSLGEEKDTERWPLDSPEFAIVGEGQRPEDFFTSRADGQAALDAQRNEPKVVYPENSILWKFENLRWLMAKSEGKINALSITNEARKAGLDFRIIDAKAPDFKGSKVNLAADQITEVWKEWKADSGTQLVFIDLSTPKGTPKAAPVLDPTDGETVINMDEVMAKASGYSVYDSLREKLIAKGIPAREIAFIHDAHTQEQKRKLFAKVNRGEVRVLMGSSFKMGAGTNVQERMVAIHHIDVPWRPSDLEQRDGRGIRQGNDLYMRDPDGFEFQLHRYATEKTYDTRMWQIVQHKASGFEQFRKGAMGARKMEDIGGEASNSADMKAAASGNPLIAEEIKLRDRLKKLGNIFDAWRASRYQLENDVERWKKWPAIVAGKVKELERLIGLREPKPAEGFTLTLPDGKKVTDTEGIPTPLVAAMKEAMKSDGESILIGKYRGFYLWDTYHEWGKTHAIEASTSEKRGADKDRVTAYDVEDKFSPSGFLSRVDNYLASFEKEIESENASAAKSVLELKKAQVELAKPFEQQKEMEDTRSKLQQTQAELLKSGGSIEMSPAMQKELAEAIKERGGTPPETALRREGIREGLAGNTVRQVEAAVAPYRKAFKGLPEVTVLHLVSDAPVGLRDAIAKLGGEHDTAGAWHNGGIYLFADNINSPMHAEWVLIHEATHDGLRGILGQNLKPLMMDLYARNGELRKLANEQRRINANLSVAAATEEALANMGADGVPAGLMTQIIAAVRRLLRQMGFKLQLADAEVRALVADALRFVKEGPGQTHALSGTAMTRTAAQPPSAQGNLGLAPASRGLIGHYVNVANKVIDFTDRLSNPLVDLPGQADYLGHRQITMGIIDRGNDIVKMIKAVFKDATPEARRAAHDYFTTAGATLRQVPDALRIGVENIKKLINEMSDKLVSSGVISEEAREEFRDRYLPQLYLRWLLDDKHWKMAGIGKKASELGYTKERKLTQFRDEQGNMRLKEKGTGRVLSDKEVLSLGPVTDPAFLASVAISRSLRDMAILDWLGKISQDTRWVLPNTMVKWNSKLVSPYFLKEDANRLRKQADHYNEADAKRTREYADRMDSAANQAIDGMPQSREDYLQIPTTPRYGALRGIWVRKEIYHDLMGSSSDMSNDPNWFKDWFGTGGKGETLTRWWKATKTILNLPGQLRNIATNFSQLQLDGVGFHEQPALLAKAVSQMRSNGPYFKEFKTQGGRGGTFSNQELGRMERDLLELQAKAGKLSTMQTLHRLAAIVYNASGDAWQAVEVLGKMMAFVDARDAGATPSKAMARANKVLFDYSLVPPWIRYARRVPFGIAFATWNAKVLPRLVETALKNPQRYLPYAIFFYGAQFALAAMLGVDYDDLEKLKKAMPEWLASKRHAVLMPWKDAYGRWEVVDMGYIMPWTNWLQLATDAATGKVSNLLQDIGAFSGPIPNVITAISTGQDPFTHRDIAVKGDPPARQASSWLNYAWSMAAPPFLSETGALGHGIRAYTGKTNKYGDPLDTPGQAALRAFGINHYALEPEQTRAANLRKQQFEIGEVHKAAVQRLQDRSLTPEQRTATIEEYQSEARRRQEKLVKYIAESGIHPNLQTGR